MQAGSDERLLHVAVAPGNELAPRTLGPSSGTLVYLLLIPMRSSPLLAALEYDRGQTPKDLHLSPREVVVMAARTVAPLLSTSELSSTVLGGLSTRAIQQIEASLQAKGWLSGRTPAIPSQAVVPAKFDGAPEKVSSELLLRILRAPVRTGKGHDTTATAVQIAIWRASRETCDPELQRLECRWAVGTIARMIGANPRATRRALWTLVAEGRLQYDGETPRKALTPLRGGDSGGETIRLTTDGPRPVSADPLARAVLAGAGVQVIPFRGRKR